MTSGHEWRLHAWRRLQTTIESCRECCERWPGRVVRPIQVGEIPNPPASVDILFVGTAPTPEGPRGRGAHFYTSPADRLRRGLFELLSEAEFGLPVADLPLRPGDEAFHNAHCFFVHAAKVRPTERAAPPAPAIEYCARRHLQGEIAVIRPRVVCFLGGTNARAAARALFGKAIGDELEPVRLGDWSGYAVVAPQPIRGRTPGTREVLRKLWVTRP